MPLQVQPFDGHFRPRFLLGEYQWDTRYWDKSPENARCKRGGIIELYDTVLDGQRLTDCLWRTRRGIWVAAVENCAFECKLRILLQGPALGLVQEGEMYPHVEWNDCLERVR